MVNEFITKHWYSTIMIVRGKEFDLSRKLKPEIPLIGDNNIPLRHEIEFQMDL